MKRRAKGGFRALGKSFAGVHVWQYRQQQKKRKGDAATGVQTLWRRWAIVRQGGEFFERKRRAKVEYIRNKKERTATALQSAYRGQKQRKVEALRLVAAKTIQKTWRNYKFWENYRDPRLLGLGETKVYDHERRKLESSERRKRLRNNDSRVQLKTYGDLRQENAETKRVVGHVRMAAIRLQAIARVHLVKKQRTQLQKATLIAQKLWRGRAAYQTFSALVEEAYSQAAQQAREEGREIPGQRLAFFERHSFGLNKTKPPVATAEQMQRVKSRRQGLDLTAFAETGQEHEIEDQGIKETESKVHATKSEVKIKGMGPRGGSLGSLKQRKPRPAPPAARTEHGGRLRTRKPRPSPPPPKVLPCKSIGRDAIDTHQRTEKEQEMREEDVSGSTEGEQVGSVALLKKEEKGPAIIPDIEEKAMNCTVKSKHTQEKRARHVLNQQQAGRGEGEKEEEKLKDHDEEKKVEREKRKRMRAPTSPYIFGNSIILDTFDSVNPSPNANASSKMHLVKQKVKTKAEENTTQPATSSPSQQYRMMPAGYEAFLGKLDLETKEQSVGKTNGKGVPKVPKLSLSFKKAHNPLPRVFDKRGMHFDPVRVRRRAETEDKPHGRSSSFAEDASSWSFDLADKSIQSARTKYVDVHFGVGLFSVAEDRECSILQQLYDEIVLTSLPPTNRV